jgi:hypothetical protein
MNSAKMANIPMPGFRKYWPQEALLKSEYHAITNTYSEAAPVVQRERKVCSDIENLAGCIPAKVGESSEWTSILNSMEETVQAPRWTRNDTLKIATVVQQIITELNEAVSEKGKIIAITKMAARVYRPLKVIAFNANDIWRRCYELSKQLQDLYIDVALFSETHLKPHDRFFVPNYHFYWTDRFLGRKGIPHNHVDLCYTICAISTLDKGEAHS